jgi:penicillin-binding protein 1A
MSDTKDNGFETVGARSKYFKTSSDGPILPGMREKQNNKGDEGNNLNFKKVKKLLQNKFVKLCLYGLTGILGAWIFLNIFIVPINRVFGLPKVDNLENYSPISSIEVYDKNEQFVTVLQGAEDRQVVSLNQVATPLKQALFASEDRTFYQHSGINFKNIIRAFVINLSSGKLKQGGSTITQQLVKNIFFSPKEWGTVTRKFKEALLTIEVEKKYTKNQILEIYLNQIYWGKSAYGVERASKRYFDKHASELNVAESAYLVALLSSPSTLYGTNRAIAIQKQIIKDMVKYGYITKLQARDALNYPLHFKSDSGNFSKFPYYMSVVLEEIRSRFSEQEIRHKGLKVYTAIDQEAQAQAEQILAEGIKKAPTGISQGALVTIDVASGEVRVIVGGVGDFWKHQWNRATSIHTIGSAFKPFVYLAAFMKGLYSSNSTIQDTPYMYQNPETGEVWTPKNFDSSFWGEITIRKALVNSRNIPAVRVAERVGIPYVIEIAEKVGLKGVQPYLSSALGSSAISPLNAANAYAVLARGGIYMKPIIIKRITTRNGKIIDQTNVVPEKVLPPGPINELTSILVDVVDHGTATQAKIPGVQIAGKTGTADGSRDVWFIGFTPDTVTALWGGNDNNKKASQYATGGAVMASIWRQFMTTYMAINPMPISFFPKPQPTIKLLVDPITGLLATNSTYQPEYRNFIPGTEPKKYAPTPTSEDIDKYLKEKQKRTVVYEEELEDPENIEEKIQENTQNNSSQTQGNLQAPNEAQNIQQRPVSIQETPIQQINPVIPQNLEQPRPRPLTPEEAASEDTKKRRLFFRKWKNEDEENNPPQEATPAPVPRWKRLFNSPY